MILLLLLVHHQVLLSLVQLLLLLDEQVLLRHIRVYHSIVIRSHRMLEGRLLKIHVILVIYDWIDDILAHRTRHVEAWVQLEAEWLVLRIETILWLWMQDWWQRLSLVHLVNLTLVVLFIEVDVSLEIFLYLQFGWTFRFVLKFFNEFHHDQFMSKFFFF